MTNLAQFVEVGARAIAPRRWEVMDSYLEQAKRKYAGKNVGWPADQFQDKESMAQFRAGLLAILPLLADDLAGVAEEYSKENDDLMRRTLNRNVGEMASIKCGAADQIAQAIRTRIAAIIGEGK